MKISEATGMARRRTLARRDWLAGALGAVAATACADDDAAGSGGAGGGTSSAPTTSALTSSDTSNGTGVGGAGGGGPAFCTPTVDNLEGPFYRADAPLLKDLTTPQTAGTRITVQGRVLDADCQPLAGAVVDVWQADSLGDYDNDGVDDPVDPNAYVLRGQQNADADGNYSFRTIIPGRYLNGNQYRPAHIHIKVSAPGQTPLTTQLYFEGDPFNDIDPFILPPLIMAIEDLPNGEKRANFDFILPRR